MTMAILLTGATGLLGRAVLARLLAADANMRAFVLVRDADRWTSSSRGLLGADRVTPIVGDLCAEGLGLDASVRHALHRTVSGVVHLAADTTFSRPLAQARAVNTEGTRRVLELASDCTSSPRVAYVSTAFVAGKRIGVIGEGDAEHDAGWANAYEQSKYEAEA
ncbi:MAG TPA: SDR family oxidoreductase, partial [Gemmatimonadaceae bacterium]